MSVPVELQEDVYVCPISATRRAISNSISRVPLPVHELTRDSDPASSFRLQTVLNPNDIEDEPADWKELWDMCRDDSERQMWCLGQDWEFQSIEGHALRSSQWHHFEGLKINNLRELFGRIVLGLEEALYNRHGNLSARSIGAFWKSWQVEDHLYEMARRFEQYLSTRARLQQKLGPDVLEAVTFIQWKIGQLCSYISDAESDRREEIQRCGPSLRRTGIAALADVAPTPRKPDVQTSRERLALIDKLARELARVKQDTRKYCSVEELKRKHPGFQIWQMIEHSEVMRIAAGEAFTPKAYAENLVLAHFGLTSRETLKKDRRKIRNAPR